MITAIDIDILWPVVQGRIQAVADEYDCGWNAEDVYHSIRSGQSFLYTQTEGNGFVVIYYVPDAWSGKLVLKVWVGCNDDDACSQEVYLQQLNQLAAEMGCCRIEMQSKRRGFERCGWQARYITYTRKVVPI
jgi:hypothetical protein